jgi:RNA polymerase sigma factor (sigma-70 family)
MPTKVQSSPETVADEDVTPSQSSQETKSEREHALFAEMATKHEPRVRRILIRQFGSKDIDDILQKAYLRAWKRRKSYDPQKGSFHNWYGKIARNTAIDHYSLRRRESSMEETESSDPSPSPSSEELSESKLIFLQMWRRCRDEHERDLLRVYRMHHSEGYSWVELRDLVVKRPDSQNWPKTPQGLKKACDQLVHRLLQELNGK